MKRFLNSLKNNIWLVFNIVFPFIIFLIPVYSENYIDESEKITFLFNSYNLLDFNKDIFFSILYLLIIFTILINCVFLIIMLIDKFEINLIYKKFINILIKINNLIFVIISLIILIYTIIISFNSHQMNFFTIYNKFNAGSFILFTYALITNMFIFKKYKG